MDVMTALRNEGAVSPAATLQEHIARAMRAVREQATTTETDPIGPAGRYALWRLARPGHRPGRRDMARCPPRLLGRGGRAGRPGRRRRPAGRPPPVGLPSPAATAPHAPRPTSGA